jgi:hypothetical protein
MNKIKNVIIALTLLILPILVPAASVYACEYKGGLSMPCPVEQSVYSGSIENNPIVQWIVFGINIISALVGIGSIIMVIIGGIQYSAAGDNPQAVQAAKKKITNVLIGLATYVSFYAMTNWLIPGGLL